MTCAGPGIPSSAGETIRHIGMPSALVAEHDGSDRQLAIIDGAELGRSLVAHFGGV
jgi:hypothetical protein